VDYKQAIELESQETIINIDYFEKKIRICIKLAYCNELHGKVRISTCEN
jgi:hypothetical protein